jgi:hypothetical protein
VFALTGGAARPKAFPLLKVDRQCISGGESSQVDPKRPFAKPRAERPKWGQTQISPHAG